MAQLRLDNLRKAFGKVEALRGITIDIPEGTFAAILGPSGCGKSTLLRILAGLETPTAGRVFIGEDDVTETPPERRNLGMMFQSYALFPHMSVAENVRFPLRIQRQGSKAEQDERVQAALELVQLSGMEKRFPRQLSGGQQQRVAFARAVIANPRALLLDEPLSNLDAKLREEMQVELIELHRKLGITTVLVTHDQDEALSLADLVVLMNFGEIEQVGTPEEVYRKPSSRFVADFLGAANVIRVQVEQSGQGDWHARTVDGGSIIRVAPPPSGAPGRYDLVLRQEDLVLERTAESLEAALEAVIDARVYRGSSVRFVVRAGDLRLKVEADHDQGLRDGDSVVVGWRVDQGLLIHVR